MSGRRSAHILDIDEVRARFESWRQTRMGKARIPDELLSGLSGWPGGMASIRRPPALHLDGGG